MKQLFATSLLALLAGCSGATPAPSAAPMPPPRSEEQLLADRIDALAAARLAIANGSGRGLVDGACTEADKAALAANVVGVESKLGRIPASSSAPIRGLEITASTRLDSGKTLSVTLRASSIGDGRVLWGAPVVAVDERDAKGTALDALPADLSGPTSRFLDAMSGEKCDIPVVPPDGAAVLCLGQPDAMRPSCTRELDGALATWWTDRKPLDCEAVLGVRGPWTVTRLVAWTDVYTPSLAAVLLTELAAEPERLCPKRLDAGELR